jgi:hypothetical protein
MTEKKPNISILRGDDVGWWDISYKSRGQMGYRIPTIDRIASEGVAVTDDYAQQSCTAGRAAFITGQNPPLTGLTKVGLPEQRAKTMQCWPKPFVKLRAMKIFHLWRDPCERANENSNTYRDWVAQHDYLIYGAQVIVAPQVEDFVKFPPRQKPASFNPDVVMASLQDASGGGRH